MQCTQRDEFDRHMEAELKKAYADGVIEESGVRYSVNTQLPGTSDFKFLFIQLTNG